MPRLLLFGPGYTASRLAARLEAEGWQVDRVRRPDMEGDLAPRLAAASHILSSVPPAEGGGEPVLDRFGDALAASGAWRGYLSSTGVYGDTGGAWVDETAPLAGRRSGRRAADIAWGGIGARVFRLPGIYGPGRSMLDRVEAGQARRIDVPGQLFSRVHVDDIVSGIVAAIARDAPAGAYNLADDLPASQNRVVETACALLGLTPPPLVTLEEAALSPMARAFWSENRRVANGKAKRLLGWRPRHPDWRSGLRAILAGR